MVFDHGSDSITGFLLGIQFGQMVGIWDPIFFLCLMFFFIAITYFCAMWTQYCTGFFRLGRINVVDEGLPSYALACFLAPTLKFSYYANQQHIYGTWAQELFTVLAVLLCFQLISINKSIMKSRIKRKR